MFKLLSLLPLAGAFLMLYLFYDLVKIFIKDRDVCALVLSFSVVSMFVFLLIAFFGILYIA